MFCSWAEFQAIIWALASALVPSVSKINEALFVTYKLLFILSKNIVPNRSYRYLKMDVYIRDRTFPVTRLPAPIYIKFDVSNGIYNICLYIDIYIDRYRGYRNYLFCKRVNFYTIIDRAISDPRS